MEGNQVRSRIVSNAGILAVTQIISKVLGTLFTIVIARTLLVEDYGILAFASTLGELFGMVVAFGFPLLITRNVARDIDKTGDILGIILPLEGFILVITTVGLVVTLLLTGNSFQRVMIISILGLAMLLNSILTVITAFFRAHQRMVLEALVRLPLSLLNLGLGLAVLLAGFGVLGLSITQLIAMSFALILALLLTNQRIAHLTLSINFHAYKQLLLLSLPFALSSLFIYAYHNVDLLMLSFIKGDQATGLYAGASNFVQIFSLLPASLMGAFLPVMSQYWKTSRESWNNVYTRSLKYLLIIALPISVGLSILSGPIIKLIMGEKFTGAIIVLQIMAWVIIFIFLNHGLSNALISINREKIYLRIVFLVMIFNAIANLSLIPIFGVIGAVITNLLTEALMLLFQFFIVSKSGLKISIPSMAMKPVASVIIMGLCVYLAKYLGFGLVCLIFFGAVIYPMALFFLKTFDSDEIELTRFWWSKVMK